jgi:hypothetical protein
MKHFVEPYFSRENIVSLSVDIILRRLLLLHLNRKCVGFFTGWSQIVHNVQCGIKPVSYAKLTVFLHFQIFLLIDLLRASWVLIKFYCYFLKI